MRRAGALDPPAFLRLAGHPLRWRLLAALSRSDRRVHELVDLVGEPQNLVSYHLGRLREADLVTSRRSSADGRDTYYRVDLARVGALLAGTGAALHPALRLEAPTEGGPASASILFLCTGNSARSQMAAALATSRSGGMLHARSAGSHPKSLHPEAVRVARDRWGIDIGANRPTHISEVADERFDRVVTLCDRVREVCPELTGAPMTAHWSMADPSASDDVHAAFERTAAELEVRVDLLLDELAHTEHIPA